MPYSRPQNYQTLLDHLTPYGVEWHLICHHPETIPEERPNWVRVHDCGEVHPKWDPCYWKLNWFIRNAPIADADNYLYACDDDALTVESVQAFATPAAEVAVCSCRKGVHPQDHPRRPGRNCPIQWAKPQHMRSGKCGMTQFAVKGRVLRRMHFRNRCNADGLMAEWLVARFKLTYFPEAFIYHNWYEPGRKFLETPNFGQRDEPTP